MTRKQFEPTDDPENRMPQQAAQDLIGLQAQLAHDERNAALLALAGRLAHQVRNPLAAVRAACSGLCEEIEDPEQLETLDLILQEIDRMLGHVRSTVQSIPVPPDSAREVDVWAELLEVVEMARAGRLQGLKLELGNGPSLPTRLPRDRLRVALFSLIDHLAEVAGATGIRIDAECAEDRLLVSFCVSAPANDDLSAAAAPSQLQRAATGWVQPVGLLVAERFARDMGGRLQQASNSDAELTLTLDLPCADV